MMGNRVNAVGGRLHCTDESLSEDVASIDPIVTEQDWITNQSRALQRLVTERAVDQLRHGEGLMAQLGSENGALKLDWVEGVARLLADVSALEHVEAEAQAILDRGIRHVIWAGMGGSVMTARVLTDLGFLAPGSDTGLAVYPLDSTDPAALNEIVREVARSEGVDLPAPGKPPSPDSLRALLGHVMIVAVSMGMTSEEPITHLEWFLDLIRQAGLSPAEHCLIMTLPASYLDRFATEHHLPARPLQLDGGTGTPGRMSAPATRVFLLPAALALAQSERAPGQLREMLQRAWQAYDLPGAADRPEHHPYVRLAAALADTSRQGVVRLLLAIPDEWQALVPWIEQLMEESLGKDGKGVLVFANQHLPAASRAMDHTLPVQVGSSVEVFGEGFSRLRGANLGGRDPRDRLAALAVSFLGWELTTALYGYLQGITFVGQPAVEDYKARARDLRSAKRPLDAVYEGAAVIQEGRSTLLAPPNLTLSNDSPAAMFADVLRQALQSEGLDYLDLTINGELPGTEVSLLETQLRHLGNEMLGIPVKLRRAPAAYHSTEQSEMAGSPRLVSLRVVTDRHEETLLGNYDDTFLLAQAAGTWQAMTQQGRSCFLLIINDSPAEGMNSVVRFLRDVGDHLGK